MSTKVHAPQTIEQTHADVDARRFWWAGLLTIVVAVGANLILRALMVALIDLPAAFPPLQPGAIALLTAIGVGLGASVFALVSRRAQRPARTFRIIAAIALVVSILPNLALMANPASTPIPGGTAVAYGVLIVFHVLAALVTGYLLPALTHARRRAA